MISIYVVNLEIKCRKPQTNSSNILKIWFTSNWRDVQQNTDIKIQMYKIEETLTNLTLTQPVDPR